jgi:TPR repeat protein
MLAILSMAVALSTDPTANPQLTAALAKGASRETYETLGTLAEAGVPGARALYDGYGALGFAGRGSDFPAACRAWETAAEVSAEAAHFTAECYEHGHDGVRDLPRAVALYTLAGDGGFAKSLCALGNLYMTGKGVPTDAARAVALCRRGAEMGDADAQTDLGNFYLRGQGVVDDHAEARRWYELAAAQNQKNAAFVLGQMYWNGDTVLKDNATAIRYWLVAYDRGREDAAILLANGFFVKGMADRDHPNRDALMEAMRWFDLAIPNLEDPAERAEAENARGMIRRLLSGR